MQAGQLRRRQGREGLRTGISLKQSQGTNWQIRRTNFSRCANSRLLCHFTCRKPAQPVKSRDCSHVCLPQGFAAAVKFMKVRHVSNNAVALQDLQASCTLVRTSDWQSHVLLLTLHFCCTLELHTQSCSTPFNRDRH